MNMRKLFISKSKAKDSGSQKSARQENVELLKTLAWAVAIALVIRSLFFEPFHIPSGSMKNNLLIGDYLFVSKYSYGYSRYSFPLGLPLFEGRVGNSSRPQRGDVVVFRLPAKPSITFIKRIVGLPGDTIRVQDGNLIVNGVPYKLTRLEPFRDNDFEGRGAIIPRYLEEMPGGKSYEILDANPYGALDNTPEYRVPEGHYFAMGDNRDNSEDSRVIRAVGFIPEENIVGKARIVFLSIDTTNYPIWMVWKWGEIFRKDRFLMPIK